MMNEASLSNLYWEVRFLPQRCCVDKEMMTIVLGLVPALWYTFFFLRTCKTQLLTRTKAVWFRREFSLVFLIVFSRHLLPSEQK